MKRIVFLLIFSLTFSFLYAQKDTINVRPFHFSFIYPVSTAGVYSVNNGYIISVNVLAGITGAANGLEIGGITNVNRFYNKGIQIAGISNVNGSYNRGFQLAGICNLTGSYSYGVQTAGICNVTGGTSTGLQLAGISNITGDDMQGIQIAGISNVTGGDAGGAQLAGISNISEDITGIQTAGIINIAGDAHAAQIGGIGNVADEVQGIQVGGIFNVAGYVKGIQLAGIINICDSIDGVPLALISIVDKGGYRRWDVWGSETFLVNLSYKIGIRELYTIFSLGYKPGDLELNTGLGVGLGTSRTFGKRSSVELEAHMYQINRYLWVEEDNFIYTLRMNYAYNLGKRLAVFAGPSFNLMQVNRVTVADEIVPSWAGNYYSQSYNWRTWIGFNAGVRF